ncbi:MerR family transcriptional regulator [Candidatus Dependentiae bacterium]|nr:MerR family transcriptional regulator [Candidatus Dependentiae bacterium]
MELVKQQTNTKRRLKIGDIAEHLQLKKFVVRSWEKELGITPQNGFYGVEDIELFKKIKQLILIDRKSLEQVKCLLKKADSDTVIPAASDVSLSAVEQDATCLLVADEALIIENAIVAPAERCADMEDSEISEMIAQSSQEQAQQKFLAELAFFKQELVKFKQLLNV